MAAPGPSRTCASWEATGLGACDLCWREETRTEASSEAVTLAEAATATATEAATATATEAATATATEAATATATEAATATATEAATATVTVTVTVTVSSRQHKSHAPSRVASHDAQVREGPGAAMGSA
jgi:hypothetical protein